MLINYTGGSQSGGVLETSSGSNWGGTHNVVIEGLIINGNYAAGIGIAVIQGSHHITIKNCAIVNTGATGIALNATDYVTVKHNMIYHTGYRNGWSSGISLWYGGPSPAYGGATAWHDHRSGFHNVIVDNIVSGAYDNSPKHSDGNGIIVDGSGSIPPVLIANNLVYENGGRGIEVFHNSGNVWIVNNTAYANGLDRKVDSGTAPDYAAVDASNVHFVDDLSYARRNGAYRTAFTYKKVSSHATLVGNLGFNGSAVLPRKMLRERRRYRYANPRFVHVPTIPGGGAPWAYATPPWRLGSDFKLRRGSPAVHRGVGLRRVAGVTRAFAAAFRQYVATDLAGRYRGLGSASDIGALQG